MRPEKIQTPSSDDFVKAFDGRLNAMARSYDIITKNDWRAGDLTELVRECCKPFSETQRFEIDGPPVSLSPKALVGMGLVIHELATNAIKYGALSNKVGKVSIHWQIEKKDDCEVVRFTWNERDGPSVTKPSRKGFGTELIKAVVNSDLHGDFVSDIAEDGLNFVAIFPIENLFAISQPYRSQNNRGVNDVRYWPKTDMLFTRHMSAVRGKADMMFCGNSLLRSLLGVKRT